MLNFLFSGTIQGKFQKDGLLGPIDSFINERRKAIKFEVKHYNAVVENQTRALQKTSKLQQKRSQLQNTIILEKDGLKRCLLLSTLGEWRKGKWIPRENDFDVRESTLNKKNSKLNTLWIYGDSLGKRFYDQIKNGKLCTDIFSICKLTYTWTYTFKNHYDHYEDRTEYNGNDFNETRFLEPIRNLLDHQLMRNRSALVINFGVHVIMTIQLHRAMKLFKMFLLLVQEKLKGNRNMDVIWKTTTPPFIEHSKIQNKTHFRFLTKQVSLIVE